MFTAAARVTRKRILNTFQCVIFLNCEFERSKMFQSWVLNVLRMSTFHKLILSTSTLNCAATDVYLPNNIHDMLIMSINSIIRKSKK